MTRTGFVLANLGRKKTRTVLTLLSIVMAFLLFGLLQAVNVLFSAGADFVGATRLVTQARVSFTQSLPLRLLPQIESVPGVDKVMWSSDYPHNESTFGYSEKSLAAVVAAVGPDNAARIVSGNIKQFLGLS